jgi:lipopolysaccharide biosynthesis glycosyltransferase
MEGAVRKRTVPTERQRARAEAHRLMDGEPSPGAGARAAGLLAWEDGYDELAAWLLSRLPDNPADAPVQVALQSLAWRRGEGGGLKPTVEAALAARPAAEAAALWLQLLQCAGRCARPLEALDVIDKGLAQGAAVGDAATWRRVAGDLRRFGTVGSSAGAGPDVWVIALPNGQAPIPVGPARGDAVLHPADWLDGFRAGARLAARRRLLHWGWGEPEWPRDACACAEHLPSVAGGHLVLMPGGVLNRHTARHWLAALSAWPDVRVISLRAHDPGAADTYLIEALRRHEPVGVADLTSWWLLREWGVVAVLDPLPEGCGDSAPDDLWNRSVPSSPAGSSWPSLAVAWGRQRSAAALRQAWSQWAGEAVSAQPAVVAAPLPATVDTARLRTAVQTQPMLSAADSSEPIEIALAVDEHLAEHAAVVMESCLARASRPVRFHLLTRAVPSTTVGLWCRLLQGRAGLVWHRFDEVRYPGRLRLLGHTSVSTLDRLLLPELLSAMARVIYLDIDLVVLGDVAELWQLMLGEQALAARPSHSEGTRWGMQMLYRALSSLPAAEAASARDALHRSGPLGFRAFNAGVLVMNLGKMRADHAAALCIGLVERCAMNDQDALNAYTRGAYLALPSAWNAAPRQDVTAGAQIVHFVGPVKPWDDLYVSRRPEFERVQTEVRRRLQQSGHG